MEFETGRVKWFNDSKGFGFITRDAQQDDVYVHYTNIITPQQRILSEGNLVKFTVKNGPKGLEAQNV